MIPPIIVAEALAHGIRLIAITDHNASANVAAVMEAAQGSELTVLPGMEVHTSEDVHVLVIFQALEQLKTWQEIIDRALPQVPNRPDFFGEQYVVDKTGAFLHCEERLLIQPTSLSLDAVSELAAGLGGLVIPAHVERKAYGLIGVLGFAPPGVAFDAMELSRHIQATRAIQKFPQLANYPLIQSGDVHHPDEFLGCNLFTIQAPTLDEIRLALSGQAGRSFTIQSYEPAAGRHPQS